MLTDSTRPEVTFRWLSLSEASIGRGFSQYPLVSVQIPYHAGWRPTGGGENLPLAMDALGFIVIGPLPSEVRQITLVFDGGLEHKITRATSVAAFLLAIIGVGVAERKRLFGSQTA